MPASFKFGYLRTNANQLESQQGSLVESKNVTNQNGVLRPRPGLELVTGDVYPITWNGGEAPDFVNEEVAFRILKMIPHSGSIYAIGIIGAPDGQSYTEAEDSDGYVILKLDEDAEFSTWSDVADIGTDTGRTLHAEMGWRVSRHAFSYLMTDDGRNEVVPHMVSTPNELLITTAMGVISCPAMGIGKDEALTLNGQYVPPNSRVFSTDPTQAGAPDAGVAYVASAGTTIGYAVPPEAAVAYRYAWVKLMPNGVEVMGQPSGRALFRNTSTSLSVDTAHACPIPLQILESEDYERSQYFLRIFRTKFALVSESGDYTFPDENYYALDDIYPTSSEFSFGAVAYQDILALESDGTPLSISSTTLLDMPSAPYDCRAIGRVGSRCLYGDIKSQWELDFSILAVDDVAVAANSGLVPGAAGDGDLLVVGNYAFILEDATNTTVYGTNVLERLSIPTDGIHAGVAGATERVKKLSELLVYRVNAQLPILYNTYFSSDQVRALTSGLFLNPSGADSAPYASLTASCWKDPNPSAWTAGRYGERPIVGTSEIRDAPTISPPPRIDGDDGKSMKIVAMTGGGTYTTASAHGFSVGDSVHMSFNPGFAVTGSPAPFYPGIWTVIATPTSTTFTVAGGIYGSPITCPAAYGSNSLLFLGAATKVKRMSDGATHGAMAKQDVVPGAIMCSSYDEYQHVPKSTYRVLGNPGAAVLAISEIAGTGFVFKEDGVWRADESWGSGGLSYSLFDETIRIVSPHAVCKMGGYIYAWSTRGVMRISEGGAEPISLEIDDLLEKVLSDAPDSNRLFAHMFAHQEKGLVYLWVSEDDSPSERESYANACYVYDGNGWQKHQVPAATACMSPPSSGYAPYPAMMLSVPYFAGVHLERRLVDSDDVVDEKLTLSGITKTGAKSLTASVSGYMSALHNDGPSQWPQGLPWGSDPWFTDKLVSGSASLLVNESERIKVSSLTFRKQTTAPDTLNDVVISTETDLPTSVTSAVLCLGYESKAISVASEYDELGSLKHFQDVSFCFARPFFTSGKVYFFSDSGSDIVDVSMPGFYSNDLAPWPASSTLTPGAQKHLRQYVPKNHRRGTSLCVGFSNNAALEFFGVSAVSLTIADVGGQTSRRGGNA